MEKKVISFGRGVPAREAITPVRKEFWSLAEQVNAEHEDDPFHYAVPEVTNFGGFVPLKFTLAEMFSFPQDPKRHVIIGNGGEEIIGFLFEALEPGFIVFEEMSYDRAIKRASRLGHTPYGVRLTESGLDLNELGSVLKRDEFRAVYHIIYSSNPTGVCADPENVKECARICRKYKKPYICDIAYFDARYDGEKNPLPNFNDPVYEYTCFVGSFSKTLTPGAKCGFGLLPKTFVDVQPIIDDARLNPNYPTQVIYYEMIKSGFYARHQEFLRNLYNPKRVAINSAFEKYLPGSRFPAIPGGFFRVHVFENVGEVALISQAANFDVEIFSARSCIPLNLQPEYSNSVPVRFAYPRLNADDIRSGISISANSWKMAQNFEAACS